MKETACSRIMKAVLMHIASFNMAVEVICFVCVRVGNLQFKAECQWIESTTGNTIWKITGCFVNYFHSYCSCYVTLLLIHKPYAVFFWQVFLFLEAANLENVYNMS